MKEYQRKQKCELCGNIFIITKKFSRTKRCNDCLQSIKYGKKVKEADKKAPKKALKIPCGKAVSKLDTIVMEAKKLGRSVGAIINMRSRLKLGAFLDNCEYITLNQLLKVVKGCRTSGTGYALISWVQNRGLPIKHKRVNNNSFRVVLVDDFWKWAEKNKSFLDFSKMQEMILGAEPEWAKEKRLEDTLCKSIKKTSPWTALEDARLKAYVEAGEKTGHEIAQLLQRSYGAVARRCRDLGIGNPKRITPHEHSWSSEEMMEVVQSVMDATPYSLIAARMNLSEKAIRGMMYRLYKTENQDKIRQIIKEG